MMKTKRRCAVPALVGAIVGVSALTGELALADSTRPPGRNTIRECTEIRDPGFYVLTRNLTAVDDSDCLLVRASNVTIDLGGWVIFGRGSGSEYVGSGIKSISGESVRATTVRNGTITGFAGDAISLGERAVVENVRALSGAGILVGSDSIVSRSSALGFDWGIRVGSRSIVSGNIVSGDLDAIVAGRHSIVNGNTVTAGVHHGIRAESFTTVSGNNVAQASVGILAGVGSTVSGNTVQAFEEIGGTQGISVECPSNVIGNTATGFGENLSLSGDGCTNIDNLAP